MAEPKLQIEKRLDRIENAIEALVDSIKDINPDFDAQEIKELLRED